MRQPALPGLAACAGSAKMPYRCCPNTTLTVVAPCTLLCQCVGSCTGDLPHSFSGSECLTAGTALLWIAMCFLLAQTVRADGSGECVRHGAALTRAPLAALQLPWRAPSTGRLCTQRMGCHSINSDHAQPRETVSRGQCGPGCRPCLHSVPHPPAEGPALPSPPQFL